MEKTSQKVNKVKIILALALSLVLLLFLGGSVGAYLNQSINQNYATNIEIRTILFRFNGKTYLDEIGSSNLIFVKGKPTEVDLAVDVIGTERVVIDYEISFQLLNASGGTDNISPVTQAIEVYYASGGRYEFLCMLSDISGHTISGNMTTHHEELIPLRFVYSAEASEYYDNLVNTDSGAFKIVASANASVNSTTDEVVFVDDYDEFKAAFTSADSVGKTIIMLADITVSEPLTANYKVGIDLNSHTLTLQEDINVTYSTNSAQIGLTNSATVVNNTKAGGISGTGKVNITAGDCYLIDNYLPTSCYTVSVASVNGIFADFGTILESRTQKLTDGTEYKAGTTSPLTTGTDVSFLFDNLGYYCTLFNMTVDAESVIVDNGSSYVIASNPSANSRFYYRFDFTYTGGLHKAVQGEVVVRGNSLVAIKDSLVASLPDVINSGLYLVGYDDVTASYITWEIDDGYGGLLLDSYGRYRSSGISALTSVLDNFNNKTVSVKLRITKGADTSTFVFDKTVQTLSGAEITALLYNNTSILLKDGVIEEYDIYQDYLRNEYLAKSGLTSISINVTADTNDYLQVDSATDYDVLRISSSATIPNNSANSATVQITFAYGGGKTHTVTKTVVIAGEITNVTEFDMGFHLQSAFSNNDYINGEAYEFLAYGGLAPSVGGQLVNVSIDYFYEFAQTSANVELGKTSANGFYTTTDNRNPAKDYVVITYEYVQVTAQEMANSQQAYYILQDGEYVFATDTTQAGVTYYERKANIEVMPSRIPSAQDTTATIYAMLYTDVIGGEKVYVDPVTGQQRPLFYTLSLDVSGVYLNDADHIPDYNLYNVLRSCYDSNNDGVISRREADVSWQTVCDREAAKITAGGTSYLKTATAGGKTYKYIDLSSLSISNIKGIEYFINLQGVKLKSNAIVDITKLSSLANIKYLDLSNNLLTDISALAYMDVLEYLDLEGNNITSVEPLRYLPSLSVVSLKDNNITNLDPLTISTTLTSLNLQGLKNGATFLSADAVSLYSLALIKDNNPSITFTYDKTISITSTLSVAAKVMRDLEEINRVHKTLYLPTTYNYYNGSTVVTYSLNWYCNDIEFSYSDSANQLGYLGYNMPDLLFEKNTTIRVQVYQVGSSTSFYTLSRNMDIVLEPFETTQNVYIYNTVSGTYVKATDSIPDVTLLNLLFEAFNFDKSNTAVNVGNGITVAEREVISANDFDTLADNIVGTINWSNQGITSLAGIGLFKDWLTTNLNLSGNNLTSITDLGNLINLKGLTLGGQAYNFTQLNALTGLTSLYVYECYELNEQTTLDNLYAIYDNNPQVSIYLKDSTTVWNPYEELLPKLVQALNSTATFVHRGDTYNVYGDNGETSFTFNMYEVDFTFTVSSCSIYSFYLTNSTSTYFVASMPTITYSGAYVVDGETKYKDMYGKSESAYARLTLSSYDSHATKDASNNVINNITYADYYVQLNVDDGSQRIIVYNVTTDARFDVSTISELYSSRSIKEKIMRSLYSKFNADPQEKVLGYNATYDDDGNGVIDPNEVDLAFMKSASTSGKYDYFYYNATSNCYYITTDYLSANVTGSTTVDGMFAGDGHVLDGVRYLGVTNFTFSRDFDFGDGSELSNVTTLTIGYSALDFTTITNDLPKLTSLTITGCYLFIADADSFSHLTKLATLSVTLSTGNNNTGVAINNFAFLEGLVFLDNGVEKANLTSLTLKSVRTNNNAYGITPENAAYVNRLYTAAKANGKNPSNYQVGSPTQNSVSGYFRVISGVSSFCTAKNDTSVTASWTASGVVAENSLTITELKAYETVTDRMPDLGLKKGTAYWIEGARSATSFTLSTTDTITLPSRTGSTYFALEYGSDAGTKVRDYPITWSAWFVDGTNKTVTAKTITPDTATNIYNAYGNGYLFVLGTINSGVTGATNYSHFYHFVVGSGDGVYSTVTDVSLRAWLFANRNATTSLSLTDRISNSTVLSALGNYSKLPGFDDSNYIYNLTGINTVIANWGKTTAITSITMQNQRFSDISPLYDLTNLATLDLSCNVQGYVSLSNLSTNLANLVTLNLTNNISITPADLLVLAGSASSRTSLTTLNLYGTRCMGHKIALDYVKTIADANANDSITLSLNNATANAVTVNEITTFINGITTSGGNTSVSDLLANGINEQSALCVAAETYTIGGNPFVVQLPAETKSLINAYASNLSNANVNVKMVISATALNSQFANIYMPSTYRYSSGASPFYYGTTGLDITNFDTQLIAYLFNGGYLTLDGYYKLNDNVTISGELGIESLTNANLLSDGTYSITVTKGSNKLLSTEEGAIVTSGQYGLSTRTISGNAAALVYADLISNYYYDNERAVPYTAILPTKLWVKGTAQTISWTISGKINNVAITSSNFITTDASGDTLLTVDGTNDTGNAYSSVVSTTDKTYTLTLKAGTIGSDTFDVKKSPVVREYNMFIQVTVVTAQDNFTCINGLTCNVGDAVMLTTDGYCDNCGVAMSGTACANHVDSATNVVYYNLGQVQTTLLHIKDDVYYANLQNTTGATTINVVAPNLVFSSGRLFHYLIYWRAMSENIIDDVTNIGYGYVLTSQIILDTETIIVSTTEETSTQGVTTIEGMQIFCNLESLTFFGGNYANISALKTLHLTNFYYGNSEGSTDKRDYTISDFTPLLEGSKDSLVTFAYNTLGSAQMTDLSFLLGFTNLEKIFVCSRNAYSYTSSSYPVRGASYLTTNSFKYVLSRLTARGIKFYVSKNCIDAYNLKYDSTDSVKLLVTASSKNPSVDYNADSGVVNYALLPATEFYQASQMLGAFATNDANITYYDQYAISVGTTARTITNNNVAFNLVATINKDGTLYLIDWGKSSDNVTVSSGYYLTSTLVIDGVTYSAETELTKEQAETIVASTEYYTAQKSGASKLYVSVSANIAGVTSPAKYVGTRLLCRIYIEDYNYERVITVNFAG